MKNKLVYVLIFLLGALMAATGTKIYFDKQPKEELTKLEDRKKTKRKGFFQSFFDNDDFFGEEVFDQMDKMTEEMMKQMGKGMHPQVGMDDAEIDRWEDAGFVYLRFKLGEIDKNSLNLQIKDGNVTIKGQTKIENTTQNQFGSSTSISISSFHKTFPVPDGVKEEEVQIEHKEGALILKFPKAAKI
jgi:HSP20 family protein